MAIFIQNFRSLMLRCFDDDTKFLDLSKYEFVKDIGRGPFSYLYLVRDIYTNNLYAFRIVNCVRCQVKPFLESIEFVKHIKLPNFNKIYYYNFLKNFIGIPSILYDHIKNNRNNDEQILFIVEYFQNNNLETLIIQYLQRKKTLLTPTIRNKIIFGVACGMKYLHKNKILFRDLKSGHILLNDKFYLSLDIIFPSKPVYTAPT